MGVFGLYVAYYAINIVYDSFFRKEKKPEVQEEDVVLVNDEEETPQLVDDEDDAWYEIRWHADIVLINTDDVNMTPLNDPLSAVVFAADRKSIDTVFCKGKKLLEHGELKTIDKDEAIANTYRCWDSILRR